MPRGSRERLAVIGLGLALAWGTAAPAAPPRTPQVEGGVLYFRSRAFRIPLTIQEQDRARIREVQLYTSADKGESWQLAGAMPPDQAAFTFHAPRDAEYWFAVRTLDTKGRAFPPDNVPANPSLRVVVDTTPPTLTLAAMGRRGERVKVRWEIGDEHLDPRSLTLSYRAEGAPDWRQVPIAQPGRLGAEEWDSGTAAPLKVRATVEDQAGNQQQAETSIPTGVAAAPGAASEDLSQFGPPPPIAPIHAASLPNPTAGFDDPTAFGPADPAAAKPEYFAPANGPAAALRGGPRLAIAPDQQSPPGPDPGIKPLLISSTRFNLKYSVDDAGPQGPALVELWITRDGGRTWTPLPEDVDHTSPYPVDLGDEGTFGLWLVVQSATGLGERPPQPGDRPMQWVVVDCTPPSVQLSPPRVGHGPMLGRVLIQWQAADAHLDVRPVLLSYRPADQPGVPWTPIADRLDNTGQYIWTVPADVPPRFHLRIDVVDRVGNRNYADSCSSPPIIVDRSRPRGRILGLDAGGSGNLQRR